MKGHQPWNYFQLSQRIIGIASERLGIKLREGSRVASKI